jgi:hypothetical protein
MRESRTYGSVRGVPGNRHPYRDQAPDVSGRKRALSADLFFCILPPGPSSLRSWSLSGLRTFGAAKPGKLGVEQGGVFCRGSRPGRARWDDFGRLWQQGHQRPLSPPIAPVGFAAARSNQA